VGGMFFWIAGNPIKNILFPTGQARRRYLGAKRCWGIVREYFKM